MAPPRSILIFALVLLVLLAVSASTLRCHKGVNLSFGGIPIFYLWIDDQCHIGTKCMIQDFSIKSTAVKYAYGNLTFGGCFPEKVERLFSCSMPNDTGKHTTSDEIDEIGTTLDQLVLEVVADLAINAKEHLARMVSFGNGIQDLYDGILDFMELAGYDRIKIRGPFLSYVVDFTDKEKLFRFLKVLQVECDPTVKLSASLLSHLKRFSQERNIPSYILQATGMAPTVFYQLFKSAIDEVDEFFYEMAQIFKSPNVVPSEKACAFIVPSYFAMQVTMAQLLLTGSDPHETFDVMSLATKDMARRCLTRYPENGLLQRIDYQVEDTFSIIKRYAKCNMGRVKCRQAKSEAIREINHKFFKMQQKKGTIKSADFMYVVQDFNSAFVLAMQELKRNPVLLFTSPVTFIIDKTREKLLRYINFLQDKGDEMKQEYAFATACEEYICKTNLCNSIANLNKHKMTKNGGIPPKTEL